jgi:hypothetical protein
MRSDDVEEGTGESADEERAGAQAIRRKVTLPSIFVSIVVYALIIGINFDPGVRAKQAEAFGAEPLDLPVTLVVVHVQTLLFLPMPWVFWHGMRLAVQARQDGIPVGWVYLLTAGSFHPHLRRSQAVCIGGLLYCLLICGAWIAYASARGI